MRTNHDLVRLFPNFRSVEQDYFRRTRIFPIMHTVVMRRSVYERDPSLAPRLYAAFEAAKACAWERIRYVGTLTNMLPWMIDDVDEIDRVFGGDCWPYGIEPNRPTLDALMTYLLEQGLIARTVPVEDLFAPVV
jgi:4,5-dihydroxyphthalate decarboxylase